ncbi:hypothetical protein ACQCN2_23185 [Brevibacillus ginsengisoli]|uniref:hypothetical protein n=1 Tax=Brevibacillus ginsengisoli TaxID=363854 RepID=UPI003CEB0F99
MMQSLNGDQSRVIMESARKTYEKLSSKKKGIHPFKGSCYVISSLIYHIANEILQIPDEYNKIYQCYFCVNTNSHLSHHFNTLLCKNIDASIDQFNPIYVGFEFSPYGDNDQYYKDVKEVEPLITTEVKELLNYCIIFYGQEIESAFRNKKTLKK